MVTPRRSARVAAHDSSPNYNENDPPSGRKRKSEAATSSPSAKRGKKSTPKKQQTIEDAMDVDNKEEEKPESKEEEKPEPKEEEKPPEITHDAPHAVEEKKETTDARSEDPKEPPKAEKSVETTAPASAEASEPPKEEKPTEPEKKSEELSNGPAPSTEKPAESASAPVSEPTQEHGPVEPEQPPAGVSNGPLAAPEQPTGSSEKKQDGIPAQETSKLDSSVSFESKEEKQQPAPTTNGNAVEPKAREGDVPSSILEKGIVYFFFRPRVNVSDPQDITDIARSYMVLRPIPNGAKLGDGPIGDDKNVRLIAIPKKVLPLSGKDRFMAFVEKSKTSFVELKNDFMSASDYATKTAGTSHTPPVTPLAEGVYAITTTGRESHLAYMITIPGEIGEVQKDVGIRESGSFVVSAKNPKFPGPANASLGKDPGYPEGILQEFRDLRWMPLQPKLLDYANTQFLLIGESSGVEKALEQMPRDEKKDTETPMEEMEKLEGEDKIRVKHLKGDDAVFVDLGISKKEYPQVPTTW